MSQPDSEGPSAGAWGVGSWPFGALAAAYAAAHLPFLAPSLEDIDSINFALGLRDFNPAAHQPHPPGYPVYIAMGKLSLAAVHALGPSLPQVEAEALALSLLSAIAGALAIGGAGAVFRALGSRHVAIWGAVLLSVCPLFWMTGSRPMSDMPGLAWAFAAQALLLWGRLEAGAFVAALALGVRSQTFWLTVPLLFWILVRSERAAWRGWLRVAGAAATGVLAWAVPLLAATGGLAGYVAALGSQAGEDFAHVDMLWSNPAPRRLALGLVQTFIVPWASVPLALVMLALALVGFLLPFSVGVRTGGAESLRTFQVRGRERMLLLVVAFAPYAIFHLVFQETITVRYALPLAAPVAFLAAGALTAAGRASKFVAAPLAAMSLIVVAMPGLMAYAADPHPAFRAIADAERRAEGEPPGVVASHFELLRPLQAAATRLPVAPTRPQGEWLALVNYWREGGTQPAWFLANPQRTDLANIDPRSRANVVRYRWAVERRPELSGTRPVAADWYRFDRPGWFAGEGWSLTAETGGVTEAARAGPGFQPIHAWVLRRADPMHLVIGTRHLGTPADGDAIVELAIDQVVRDRWTLTANDPNALRFLDLPAGISGPGTYGVLTVVSLPAIRGTVPRRVPVAVRQFDIQPATEVIAGYGPGWHEDEYDRSTGQRWRWSSARAVLQVAGPAQPLRVHVAGESPLRYFDDAPSVSIAAGGRVFARSTPSTDFTLDATIPAEAWQAGGGAIVLETSRTFVPAEAGRSSDARRLGLRIFDVRVARAR